MNRKMRDIWNEHVQPGETVYMLGDVGFAKPEILIPFLRSLHGEKHLVTGNHDKQIKKMRQRLLDERVFVSMDMAKEIYIGDDYFVLYHYGQRTWNKAHHGSIHLFGHTHGSLPPLGKSVDVGVDDKNITDEYRPVSLDEVLRFMSKRESHTKHHDGEG
jgi:calcineurin-like phosphoesterase family protein